MAAEALRQRLDGMGRRDVIWFDEFVDDLGLAHAWARAEADGLPLFLMGHSLGGLITAAYVVDYHLVPSRLTPGWERQISPRALALVFGALALSLPVRSLARRRR